MRLARGRNFQIVRCSSEKLIGKDHCKSGDADLTVVGSEVFFSDEFFVLVNRLKELFLKEAKMSH